MMEFPLLVFPRPDKAERVKKNNFGKPKYSLPGFDRQKEKLSGQFMSMYEAFITDEALGIEPEHVLVLETMGKIDDFIRAVRAIDGLEWLAEIDVDELDADEDFYKIPKIGKTFFEELVGKEGSRAVYDILKANNFIGSNDFLVESKLDSLSDYLPESLSGYSGDIIEMIESKVKLAQTKGVISGRLFLTMSNKRAMDSLLNLWNSWDGKSLPWGYGKWAEIFQHLRVIRKWDVQDRIAETGILKYWEEELELKKGTSSPILFEIELWYLKDSGKREEAENSIKRLVVEENGRIISSYTNEDINFHALKAELPADVISKAINHQFTGVFKSGNIMFFRPTGQFGVEAVPDGALEDFGEVLTGVSKDPIIALLDGAPFVRHVLLKDRIYLDDPDDFGENYAGNERSHGTAMASLICHGELDGEEPPLKRPIYARPIMQPDKGFLNPPRREHIPADIFMEDLLERSVRRIFEGSQEEPPVAPSIKIINISICDPDRMFFSSLSSCARLLDWLSDKYNVLFCISAGNILSDLVLEKTEEELKTLASEDIIQDTLCVLNKDNRNRRLLSPAEAINAISVGAMHSDLSGVYGLGRRCDILPSRLLPSPISANGHGFRGAVKPDIYLPGGVQLYDYAENGTFSVNQSGLKPGQKTAAAPLKPGETNRFVYTRGTSNATALATRSAAQICDILDELTQELEISIPDQNVAVLLKTLLVHSASWGSESKKLLEDCLKDADNTRIFKRILARYFGFGVPDISRVFACTEQRATALGWGEIKKDDIDNFYFPLPVSLSGTSEVRKLIITLAWFTPINPNNRRYRKANLSFEPPKNVIGVSRQEADAHQVKNGTVQHEVLEGKEVVAYQKGDNLLIPVECRDDAGLTTEEVKYGLAVTIEVNDGVEIPVYNEVAEIIMLRLKEQLRV